MAKILLAENEPEVGEMVAFKLTKSGHEIIQAYDGKEAVALAVAERPDLVVLDVTMPLLDGFEVLRRLKADPVLQSIPVIMLTAKGRERDVLTRLYGSAVDYLVKPFSPKELAGRVEAALSKRSKLANLSLPTDSQTPMSASKPPWKRYWKEFLIVAAGCFGWLALSVALGQWPATAAWVTSTPWLLTYAALVMLTTVVAYRTLLHANDVELNVSLSVSTRPTGEPSVEDQLRAQVEPVQVQVDFSRGPIDLKAVERALILEALAHAEWNKSRAAQLLGLSKETLREWIEKYRLATGQSEE